VKIRVFGCRKFSRLLSDRADRILSSAEDRFLTRHRYACLDCRKSERASDCALNMLRAAALEPEVAPMFEDRVIRRLRVQNVRESLNYWSPAFFGAGIAFVALLVALHLAAAPAQLNRADFPGGEARRDSSIPSAPNLELDRIPTFGR
jgi:hypothetical protein